MNRHVRFLKVLGLISNNKIYNIQQNVEFGNYSMFVQFLIFNIFNYEN